MRRKVFWLWFPILLSIGLSTRVFNIVIVGADGAEETADWHGHSEDLRSVHLNSQAYSLSTLIEWNKTYGGADSDSAVSVQQTSDGGYVFVGSTFSFGAGWYEDLWLVKTNAYGNMEWNRTYGGSSWDHAHSVQQTSDEGYIVTGYTASFGAGGSDFWLVKTDAYGDVEWNKTYGGSESDKAYSVQQTNDGGYVMVGSADSFKTGIFDGEIWLVKTDAYGNVDWSWLSGWPDWDFAHSVQQTSDGGYIVAGTRFSSYETRYDFWLIKLNANGTLEWDKVYARPGKNEDDARSVQQTTDGGYIIAGGWGDFWLVKTDAYGDAEWNKTYGGSESDTAYSVQQTSDGGYIVAGQTQSFGFGQDGIPDAWLIKFFPPRDVSVSEVKPSKTVVNQGFSLSINVTLKNLGFLTETFNVTVYADINLTTLADEIVIGNQTVINLPKGNQTTLAFTWNTTGVDKGGDYTISAKAEVIPSETDTANNTKIADNMVTVLSLGHDVAIKDVTPSKTVVGQNHNLSIHVTAKNYGSFTETFNITVYYNDTDITLPNGKNSTTTTLTSGNSTTITLTWNTTDVAKGNYTLSAYATPVLNETYTTDNTLLADKRVCVTIPGDVDGDFDVDLYDAIKLLVRYGAKQDDPEYDLNCDIDGDGDIDLYDAVTLLTHYGQKET